ncbi:hypothetical protein TFLX_03292 [Thermoflexales bacterium]|nr:hypothetical protein TFLX_03292 [Thermoflexales bacterium]
MPQRQDAHQRHCAHYVTYTNDYQSAYDLLDREFPQIQTASDWLAQETDRTAAELLLSLVEYLSAYLQHRYLYQDLLIYCKRGLSSTQLLGANAGWLHLLSYEAHWAIGEWDEARSSAESAIAATRLIDPTTHARAVLALGRLQFNLGEYRAALQTLSEAETLLAAIHDYDGVASVKAERAAYYLNRNELKKALSLYLEVDQLRQQLHPGDPTDHTLLMLGVVYRRLRDYRKAIEALSQLIQSGEAAGSLSAVATGTHHLAWVYYDTREFSQALNLGARAKEMYERINDPRGGSDADEQLGLIALANRDYASARVCLECSLAVRQHLGNQQGTASSLRRLAKLHLRQRNLLLGTRYLWRSLSLYQQIGMLGFRQLVNILGDLLK